MPRHKSAAKRVITNEKRRRRNASVRSEIKTVVKKLQAASGKDALSTSLREAHAALDKAAKKGVVHKRTASRRKSRLAKLVNRLAAAPAAS
jgi:small subunit ribosomal protein S20